MMLTGIRSNNNTPMLHYTHTANADSLYYVQTDLLGSWDRIVDGSSICMAME